ncbi:metallophosphoesterase [Pedobacter yulinensis]|uniref:Metallophosphoesterase n=1 Tax=Pedobacter yulinensis TaxID=2126353 RepID=A0A2T3HHR4_9SPHI|nr:metallophosphoesterase [Pedobacter yulinensis]PST81972.1 metallophosphoesterase [Pedobacter yulinensis]
MKRKEFLGITLPAILLLANGDVLRAYGHSGQKVKLRFAVASDGHYGQPGTPFEQNFADIVSHINAAHKKTPFAFCLINGDIIHNDKNLYPAVKKALSGLRPKMYVSQGNHDHVNAAEWNDVWGMPVNYDFVIGDTAFIVGTTSNEKGEYICPDLTWFAEKLEQHRSKKNLFVFVHINPAKLTVHGINCPDFLELLSRYPNLRCIFNGHDHDEEGIKTRDNLKFVFDAHFGGDWGTNYKGFRIVELLQDDTVRTWIMNPAKALAAAEIR